MTSAYEQYVTEQEARTFYGKPTRWTTIMSYPDKMDFGTFIRELRTFDIQDNLKGDDRYIEYWVELIMAYHEIENSELEDTQELKYRVMHIDQNFKQEEDWQKSEFNRNNQT